MPPRLKMIDNLDNLPDESKAVLAKYLERTGNEYMRIGETVEHPFRKAGSPEHAEWVTQFVKVLGMSPGLLRTWLEKDWYMVRESLIAKRDPRLTEMIGVVVAVALQCPYCIAWHSAASKYEGADAAVVDRLRQYEENRASFSEQQQAVFDYSIKVALHAYKVLDSDIERLRRWFSDPEIAELTELACHMAALSKFFSALDVEIW
ncbi:MAG: carboxymuconolactone decarboxylase family protein [Gammaproteobacteria bacterium]